MTFKQSEVLAPIQLGRTAPFNLGSLRVEPAARQIANAERRETVEPRVMQVLVALTRAEGAVVTRDELIAACWGGVVVGDNAIHRTISRLRELAETFAPCAFRIETIARVGYRLEVTPADIGATPREAATPTHWTRHFHLSNGLVGIAAAVASVGLAIAIGASLLAGSGHATPQAPSLRIEGEGGVEAVGIARALEAELPGALGHPMNLSLSLPGSGPARDLYNVRIRTDSVAATQRASLTLANARTGNLIWSESFERSLDATGSLRSEMVSRLAAVLDCDDQASSGGDPLDPASLRMFVGACAQLPGSPDASAMSLLRAVTERQPRSAAAWAWLSFVEAETASLHEGDPTNDEDAALRSVSADHRRRAEALGARKGLLFLSEAASIPRIEWRKSLALAERGIAADPDFGPLHSLHADMLQRVGRMTDAVQSARRGVELAPMNPAARAALVRALAYGGSIVEARDELAKAERIWPEHPLVRETRDAFDIRFGDPRELLRRIDRGTLLSNTPLELQMGSYHSYLVARADPSAAHVNAAIRDLEHMAKRTPGAAWLIQLLGSFGRIDDAYRLLERPDASPLLRVWPDTLFRSYMRPMRLDPRFMRLAARVGLVAYWRDSGKWSDFCADSSLPYDCLAEGARAEAALVAGWTPTRINAVAPPKMMIDEPSAETPHRQFRKAAPGRLVAPKRANVDYWLDPNFRYWRRAEVGRPDRHLPLSTRSGG